MSSNDDDHTPAPDRPPAPGADASAQDAAPAPADGQRVVDPGTLRRAPRYGRFALAGILLGALAALVLSILPVWDSALGRGTLFLLLFLALGSLGALLGALVAVVADRRSLRRRAARGG